LRELPGDASTRICRVSGRRSAPGTCHSKRAPASTSAPPGEAASVMRSQERGCSRHPGGAPH
jgi:hypothetical protein